MGLPIWREPETKSNAKAEAKAEPSGTRDRVRSGRVRRQLHTRVSNVETDRRRPRSLYPPILGPATGQTDWNSVYLPAVDALSSQTTTHEPRPATRHTAEDYAGVPPISTLLDTADRRAPPPVPESRNYFAAEQAENQRRAMDIVRRSAARTDRRRLIEETNRIVASLGDQDSEIGEEIVVAARPGGSSAYRSAMPGSIVPLLRRERTSRGMDRTGDVVNNDVDGLGDRNRSPTPPDHWEIMRSTIQPDTTLPSAESSFTSAAASQSFASDSASTSLTDPEDVITSDGPAEDDSSSSLNLDVCADDESLDATEALARDMYFREMESPEGRSRIAEQEALRAVEGNRFAMADELPSVDIGFRLIEAALERVEDRHRTLRLRGHSRNAAAFGPDLERLSGIIEDDRARQASLLSRQSGSQEPETSQDAPEAHPVGLPTSHMQSDAGESLIANIEGGEQDLNSMRQIVELLASREDVPEEWWMSMGLNFSRARPRRNREGQSAVRDSRVEGELARVRIGRVHRVRDDNHDRASRL